MNPLLQCKPTILPLFIAGALACFGLLPKAVAVIPAPDGGYPGFTTAEGTKALENLTTGVGNTAAGWYSLFTNSTGSFNTAVGAGTLVLNTVDENTAVGTAALLFNTVGFQNTAVGVTALLNNNGLQNTAIGHSALETNTDGGANTAIGFQALFSNITGNLNTACGDRALFGSTGAGNTGLGFQALFNAAGSDNIALGRSAGGNINTADNVIAIGHSGQDVSNTTWIGHIFGVTTVSGTTAPVIVSDNGQLGTMSSSRRFKKEIQPMDKASEAVLALKPVTFHYKNDTRNTPQFGLIAEEVAAVDPDLIVCDKNGEIYSVRYEAVNAMLLNEFLKEHRSVQELKSAAAKQEAMIARQQKQIESLTAGLQKVSARLELNKPAPQTVLINQ